MSKPNAGIQSHWHTYNCRKCGEQFHSVPRHEADRLCEDCRPGEEKLYCFRVWFEDETAVLVDAPSSEAARAIIRQGIAERRYFGRIESVERLI